MWLNDNLKTVLKDFVITHDGRHLTEFFIPKTITGRDFQEHEFTWLEIPHRDGGIITSRRVLAQPLQLSGIIACSSAEELREIIEFLNDFLYTEEAVPMTFSDETDRTYYVMFNYAESEEMNDEGWMRVTLHFARPDPYKYGDEVTADFVDGIATVVNRGTATAFPRYELEATAQITHADIIGPSNYFRLGQVEQMGKPAVEQTELLERIPMTSFIGWSLESEIENGHVGGAMKVSSAGFEVDTYGASITPHKFQGPARRRSISTALQDFRLQVDVEFLNSAARTGRIDVVLKDAAGDTVARIGLVDSSESLARIAGTFAIGETDDRPVELVQLPSYAPAWNRFNGTLRINRVGNKFRPYFAIYEYDSNGNVISHDWVFSSFLFTDEEGLYLSPITEVVVFIGGWPNTEPSQIRAKNMQIFRYNNDIPGTPIIAEPGDKIVIDTATGEISINGEQREDLRDMGSDLFILPKGVSALLLEPSDKLTGRVVFRERFR